MRENKNRDAMQCIRRDRSLIEYLFPRGKGRNDLEKEHILKMKEKETQGTQTRIAHILQISLISHISEISQIPLIFG